MKSRIKSSNSCQPIETSRLHKQSYMVGCHSEIFHGSKFPEGKQNMFEVNLLRLQNLGLIQQ